MIYLPVIEKITVRNYPLYPGEDGNGLSIPFNNGVTVLAGINGVGKTTFLNLLMRLLLGPSSPKATADISRVSKRDLVLSKSKKFDYFAKRVPDIDADATGTLEFSIGRNTLSVTRYLATLKAKSVTLNRKKIPCDDEIALINKLAELAGLTSGYDFHMVVRYLQFFTEERLPILWAPGTQFEFFKMLFFDEALEKNLSETFAAVQRIDTDYRNRRNQQTLRQKRLEPADTQNTHIERSTLDRMIRESQAAFDDINKTFATQTASFHDLKKASIEIENQLSRAEVQLAKLEEQFAHDDALYIAQALPGLDDKLNFLMQGLGSRVGCFVCGKRGKREHAEIGKTLRKGQCFVCHAPVGSSKKVTPINSKKVSRLAEDITNLTSEIDGLKRAAQESDKQYRQVAQALDQTTEKRFKAWHEYQRLRDQLPKENLSDLSPLRAEIEREEVALAKLDEERKVLTERYRTLMSEAQSSMDGLKEDLRNRMTHYASEFLQESVTVTFDRKTSFKLATGAGKVNIPTFNIGMTSSTYTQVQQRVTPDSVSESQKEFLDLAFRMTLLDLVSEEGATMIVIETPEASLDSWFMQSAATLMRTFAPQNANRRKLIATSNLNGTVMIPALLGLLDDRGNTVKKLEGRDAHLVNMMKLTATAKVLHNDDAKSMLYEELGAYIDE